MSKAVCMEGWLASWLAGEGMGVVGGGGWEGGGVCGGGGGKKKY